MSSLYVPSGKYPSYAPAIFMLTLFIVTGVCGLVYGYFNSEHIILSTMSPPALPGIDLVAILNTLLMVGIINSGVVLALIRLLKIRNPTLARRWAWWASVIGWGLFNWLGLYIASGSDLGFFQFMADRLAHGVQGTIPQRAGSKIPMYVWLNGYVLFVGWILEAVLIPLWLGVCAWLLSIRPFSEKTMSWYKRPIKLPFRIYQPNPQEIRQKINNADYDWIEYAKPNAYDKNTGEAVFFVFFPQYPTDSIHYTLRFYSRHQNYSCWIITVEEAEMLISKFDPKKKTKAPKLLNKYKQENTTT